MKRIGLVVAYDGTNYCGWQTQPNGITVQGVLKSLRPAVVAMIASAGILILKDAFWGSGESILLTGTEWSMVVIFGICALLLRKTKLNPVWVMVLAGVIKVGISMMLRGTCFQ